jgi:uncharacterized membrane protein
MEEGAMSYHRKLQIAVALGIFVLGFVVAMVVISAKGAAKDVIGNYAKIHDREAKEKLKAAILETHKETTSSIMVGMTVGYAAGRSGVDFESWKKETEVFWDQQLSNRLAEIEREGR